MLLGGRGGILIGISFFRLKDKASLERKVVDTMQDDEGGPGIECDKAPQPQQESHRGKWLRSGFSI